MTDAQQILRSIEGRKNQGAGITRFREYLHTLQDPQLAFPTIHIAGTNGKGSTCNYLRSVFENAGYRVGTFTSPYLEAHYDRIRINDQWISEVDFVAYYERYHEEWENWGFGAFEIDTIIALLYFRDQGVDIALIEAGIGGRYDCTNVVCPLLCIITNIGKDHMDRLGDSYAQIAWQKGGIIKTGIPLICGEQRAEALTVLRRICEEQGSDFIPVSIPQEVNYDEDGLNYVAAGLTLHLACKAFYQVANSACALAALKLCQNRFHYAISDQHIQIGLAQAKWKGRFELMWDHPQIIIDGAHNEDGIRALCDSLRSMQAVRILFAALKDKQSDAMMTMLCEASDEVWVSEFDHPRCKPMRELAGDFPVQLAPDYRDVIERTLTLADKPLIITGSLYFISVVREYLIERKQASISSME